MAGRQPISRAWLDEDHEKLKRLYTAGATLLRAAAALKRPTASIKKRAKRLGLHFPGMREVKRELKAHETGLRCASKPRFIKPPNGEFSNPLSSAADDPMTSAKGWIAGDLKPPFR